jgi:hypothetical protein
MGSPETPGIPGRVEVITDLRALRRALEGGIAIDRVVCPAGKPYLPALYQLVRRYHLRVQQVPPSALPKGATWGAAYVSPVPFRSVEELLAGPVEGLLVALIGITDVRNVGAIVRSAAAFSARGIIWPAEKTTSPANPELWRSSAGALSHLPLFRSHRLYTDLQKLSSAGWPLIATTKPSPQATALRVAVATSGYPSSGSRRQRPPPGVPRPDPHPPHYSAHSRRRIAQCQHSRRHPSVALLPAAIAPTPGMPFVPLPA